MNFMEGGEKFRTCYTQQWTVWELASEVATLLADTGIRLKAYVDYAKGKNVYPVFYRGGGSCQKVERPD